MSIVTHEEKRSRASGGLNSLDRSQTDALVPRARVARELGLHPRSITRWEKDETLNFPAPIVLRNRVYFSRVELEAWKAAQATQAMRARGGVE